MYQFNTCTLQTCAMLYVNLKKNKNKNVLMSKYLIIINNQARYFFSTRHPTVTKASVFIVFEGLPYHWRRQT